MPSVKPHARSKTVSREKVGFTPNPTPNFILIEIMLIVYTSGISYLRYLEETLPIALSVMSMLRKLSFKLGFPARGQPSISGRTSTKTKRVFSRT